MTVAQSVHGIAFQLQPLPHAIAKQDILFHQQDAHLLLLFMLPGTKTTLQRAP
ncbi:MAG: hypothetical protein ACOY4L_00035 [Pseudomonadota bacterium]